MNYSSFKQKFGNWADKFKEFIESSEMDEIFSFLKERSGKGHTIIPHHSNTFKVFQKTDPDKLRVVFFMGAPFNNMREDRSKEEVEVASGIALDGGNAQFVEAALQNFFDQIEKDKFNGLNLNYIPNANLQYLLNQGVMLINNDLTTERDYPDIHKRTWRKFMKYFIEKILNPYYKGLILVFNEDSIQFEKYVDQKQHYTMNYESGVFEAIDTLLKANNGDGIDWLDQYGDVPF